MNAPERIWAIGDRDDVPRTHWDCGPWRDCKEDAERIADGDPIVEYVRADIHEAAIATVRAQALEEAARVADDHGEPGMYQGASDAFRSGYADAGQHIAAAIRALATQPAP